ncbi:trace amine-associated receptor 13c-like [Thunnus maccoyii]|uniref:trace amine-associated receptor 13c-like n=1 Tax=Thunnus maccoyii TaxID=8240 RepID=UPI001C4B7A4B|nr:trace amine-associated receptor 13c-like [Thunnus maccoyii]
MEVQDEAELCFPQLLNTSCKRLTSTWSEVVFQIILLSSFSLLTVALNLLVIISVSHFRQLHTPTNLLLFSLAVSDFLVGLVVIPGAVLQQTSCWFLGDLICFLCHYVSFIITSSSVGNMVLISVDRYVAICDPLHYTTRITVRRVKLYVCLCWLFSALFSIFFIKDELTQPGVNTSVSPSVFFLGILFYFNSCLNPVIYALFYPWFIRAIKLIVTLQILQPGSCDANIL